MKMLLFLQIFLDKFKNLVAHLEKFNGAFVRRGTPVEKHWFNYSDKLNFARCHADFVYILKHCF